MKKLNVNLVCLVETRVREEKTGEIMNSVLFPKPYTVKFFSRIKCATLPL